MIYLILFSLDFYRSLLLTLVLVATIGITLLFIALLTKSFNENKGSVVRWKENPDIKLSWWERDEVAFYKLSKHILKYKTLITVCGILAILLPSKQTVYIASGIYVGQAVYDNTKENPVVQKAYKLAEEKLNELLTEKGK